MRSGTAYQIELIFIRHGKTAGNKEKRYIGKTDEGLCDEGIAELKRLRKRLQAEREKAEEVLCFSGPMKRCLESADVLFDGKKVCLIDQFTEIDFGIFEGKNYEELSGEPLYQAWIDSGGTMTFPEGESREDFCKRSVDGFYEMLTRIEECAKLRSQNLQKQNLQEQDLAEQRTISAWAVVHGGNIMAVLSQFYGGDYYDYQIANAEAYKTIICVNDAEVKILAIEKI